VSEYPKKLWHPEGQSFVTVSDAQDEEKLRAMGCVDQPAPAPNPPEMEEPVAEEAPATKKVRLRK